MKIFEAVYRHSSVTRAAEELHLAQPSVSLSLRELEDYYGVQLFERIGRRILPTECGAQFYGYALHIVTLFEEMETKIRNWDTLGTLRIGTSITIGTHILPLLIRRFQAQYPSLRTEAVVNKSDTIEKLILDNAVDVGLIETRPGSPDVSSVPFMKDSLCAVVPPEHPLASRKEVSLEELARFPFLMRENGSAGRELLDACFSLLQMSVRPLWESSSTQAIVKAVSEGIGVAVLPRLLVEKDAREHTVVSLPLNPPLQRDFHIIYHKSKYLTPNIQAFCSLCREYGASPDRSSQQLSDLSCVEGDA